MGINIDNNTFIYNNKEFYNLLKNEYILLQNLIKNAAWSNQELETGAELEGWLLNKNLLPAKNNIQFVELLNNTQVGVETANSCIEINAEHFTCHDQVISQHFTNLNNMIELCNKYAHQLGQKVIYSGTLPIAEAHNFNKNVLTENIRFDLLNKNLDQLCNFTNAPNAINKIDSIAIIGALSSFQIHLKVGLERSIRFYNTSQIISAPMLAIASNSPYIFKYMGWDESRIFIYEKALQYEKSLRQQHEQRVLFGKKYLTQSFLELFYENMQLHPPILPITQPSSSEKNFFYTRMHNGTIYRWNRPVIGFDTDETPHFRIESRILPAGPSILDMCANLAFFLGVLQYLSTHEIPIETQLTFEQAKKNFYLAAKFGIKAELTWLHDIKITAHELILVILLPMMKEGLKQLDINNSDINAYYTIIYDRAKTMQTGSVWQKKILKKTNNDYKLLLQIYLAMQEKKIPIHDWPVDI